MADPELDLSSPLRLHLVGIGGAGLTPMAEILTAMGHRVSGSDLSPSAHLDHLRQLGVDVTVGHRAENITTADALIVSTAIPDSSPEVFEARSRGIPVHRRAVALAAIAATRRTVAVAGTHGKTTTSAMLAVALSGAGLNPSFLVGGDVAGFGTGARWTAGSDLFVVEADESDSTFLELVPEVAVVTSLEPDHLDHHGTFEVLTERFERFLRAGRVRIACADDENVARLDAAAGAVTYGTSPRATYRIVGPSPERWRIGFGVEHEGSVLGHLSIALPGLHNARNATAAIAAALECGAGFEAVASALAQFGGVARRFQHRGDWNGASLVEDYAHLPTEVAAAVDAARAGGWRRIVCVFQPHRYSRTEALWPGFAHCFEGVDVLVISDVYAASEERRPGITGKLIVDAVLDAQPARRVAWFPDQAGIAAFLRRELKAGDLCLVLGAGDIGRLADELLGTAGARA